MIDELKTKVNLGLLIRFAAGKGHPNRYKREFTLQGAFRADLVVGSTAEKYFVRVEFEAARETVYSTRSAVHRNWGTGRPSSNMDLAR